MEVPIVLALQKDMVGRVDTLQALSRLERSSKEQLKGLSVHRWVEMAEVTMVGKRWQEKGKEDAGTGTDNSMEG